MSDNLELIQQIMEDVPQLSYLNKEEREILSKFVEYRKFQKNQPLCKEGQPGNSLFFITEGKVEVVKESISGKKASLGKNGKGATVGEMALIDPGARSATVFALCETETLVLKKKNFDMIISLHSAIGIKMLKFMAKQICIRLRHASDLVADVFDAP